MLEDAANGSPPLRIIDTDEPPGTAVADRRRQRHDADQPFDQAGIDRIGPEPAHVPAPAEQVFQPGLKIHIENRSIRHDAKLADWSAARKRSHAAVSGGNPNRSRSGSASKLRTRMPRRPRCSNKPPAWTVPASR